MGEAFLWGAAGASALLVGAVIAYVAAPGRKLIAIVMALGAGLLIGSVSFELIDEALQIEEVARVGIYTLIGAMVFTLGNWYLDRRGGGGRKDPTGSQEDGSPLAIVFGSILDGIPESFVLGLTVLEGGVSLGLLAGILLSNLPEGMSSSAGLRLAGWGRGRVMGMWIAVMVVSGSSAAFGYQVLGGSSSGTSAAVAQGFAAGALLAMVADTLLPESYKVERVFTGSWVAIGLAVSLMLSSL